MKEYVEKMDFGMKELQLNTIEDAIKAMAAGEMVIVVDDEDRENEGDLIMAAGKASPEKVAFMIRHTSGILCVPLELQRARRLRLNPMVHDNEAPLETAFTVSVDYKHGLTTGISAEERCNTVLALANDDIGADGFARPGHIFPLVSKEGGVLVRSGHTEAAVDLTRLAGASPVGLLAEIVNDDGSVKRLPELLDFAREHRLLIVSIADLIAYRQVREQLVERIRSFSMKTVIGEMRAHVYRTRFDDQEHLALVYGKTLTLPVLTRIHRQRTLEDVFGSQSHHADNLVDTALKVIGRHGAGIFLYLSQGTGLVQQVADTRLSIETQRLMRWREIGTGAQILRDLEVRGIRLLSGREHQYMGVKGFGIELHGTELLP